MELGKCDLKDVFRANWKKSHIKKLQKLKADQKKFQDQLTELEKEYAGTGLDDVPEAMQKQKYLDQVTSDI